MISPNTLTDSVLQESLNTLLVSQLKFIAMAFAGFYGFLTISHWFMLPGHMALVMVPVSILSSLLFVCLSHRITARLRATYPNHVSALIAVIVSGNSLLHLGISSEHFQSTNIMLFLVGAGAIFVHPRWFGGVLICSVSGWVSIAAYQWHDQPGLWLHYCFAVAFASFISILLFTKRLVTLRNNELLRWQDAQQKKMLEEMATIDALTDLYNRRFYDEQLAKEWLRMKREGTELCVLMVDIDHFKKFNDHYGHQAGDKALQAVAQAIKSSVKRPADVVARYGGEEFVVLLPNTPSWGACIVAERIRKAVQSLQIPHEASLTESYVTLSVGVASTTPKVSTAGTLVLTEKELVAQADQALYQAKALGRNRFFTPYGPGGTLRHIRRLWSSTPIETPEASSSVLRLALHRG